MAVRFWLKMRPEDVRPNTTRSQTNKMIMNGFLSLSLSTHTHTFTHTHTLTLTRTHTHSCTHIHAHTHSHTHTHTQSLSHTHTRTCAHAHTFIYSLFLESHTLSISFCSQSPLSSCLLVVSSLSLRELLETDRTSFRGSKNLQFALNCGLHRHNCAIKKTAVLGSIPGIPENFYLDFVYVAGIY